MKQFPDAPRKADVYRALVEASEQLQDHARALEYTERLIALRPDDNQMMLIAAGLLERQGDEHSLTKAVSYLDRVIDRIEKAPPVEKPARVSVVDWQRRENQLRGAMYLIRGVSKWSSETIRARKMISTPATNSLPAPPLRCGWETWLKFRTIARRRSTGTSKLSCCPKRARSEPWNITKCGKNWEIAGVGCMGAMQDWETPCWPATIEWTTVAAKAWLQPKNQGIKDAMRICVAKAGWLARAAGGMKGKIIVVSFWATWCAPCRELEPLFGQIAQDYAGKPDVVFLAANFDEDETRVQPYLAREKISVPVVFADGLDDFLHVHSLPTVILLDRSGKIVFRSEGYNSEDFAGF